jgi:DNA invertase Pin-like site-specific DNA recombinase
MMKGIPTETKKVNRTIKKKRKIGRTDNKIGSYLKVSYNKGYNRMTVMKKSNNKEKNSSNNKSQKPYILI